MEVLVLPALKKIVVTISNNLLSEVDSYTIVEQKNRSEIVRDAINFYLGERRRQIMKEQMKKGYLEMSEINLRICCESSFLEDEALCNCIHKLLE
jgi:CopG family transcriptional regulator/antitoxin EndoAI